MTKPLNIGDIYWCKENKIPALDQWKLMMCNSMEQNGFGLCMTPDGYIYFCGNCRYGERGKVT